MNNDIAWMPAVEMAAAIRTKKLSPVEVARAFLDRIGRVHLSEGDGDVHAWLLAVL